jgi:chloramphenicol 3-O-phosphotransferase
MAISWTNSYLTVRGTFPGNEIRIHYLEAYCRPGSTDRDWSETVIGHMTEVVESNADHRRLKLRDHLSDGVVVDHNITARRDEVDFRLVTSFATE